MVARERYNMHGRGEREHEVYLMPVPPCSCCRDAPDEHHPPGRWGAITDVPCPVPGCGQTVVWYEAGYVPGYRVCMAPLGDAFDAGSIAHRFLGRGSSLVRDDCCEVSA